MNTGRRLLLHMALAGVAFALTACTAHETDPRVGQFAKLPDWRGYWIEETFGDVDIAGFPEGTQFEAQINGRNAPWSEAHLAKFSREVLPKLDAAFAVLKGSGWGYPLMMETLGAFQFLVTPEETLILNFYRDVRHVYTDGRAHPPAQDRWPTPWGDSIGWWEGDTLVIDTVSVQQPNAVLGNSPLPPLTEQAHFVERLRKTGPDRIEMEMTIEDPVALREPWVIKVGYKRAAGFDRMFHGVFDNDRTFVDGDLLGIAPPKARSGP